MKHIFMINRYSLKERLDKYVKAIEKACKKLKIDYKIEINDEKHSTEDILKSYKNKNYLIYAVGGDGILNRVLNAIYKTKNKLGLIPAGTGNDFNRSINDYFNEGDNLVDVIKCNDKYFINVACFGVDADIANDEKVVHNKFIPRKFRYKASVLKHFFLYKPYNLTLKWDKKTTKYRLSIVSICNGGYYGGGYHVNPDGIYNDGLLDIYIITATKRIPLVSYLLKMTKGKHKGTKNVEHIKTDNFTIISDKEIEGNLDGERIKSKKYEMKVIPKSITFCYNKELLKEIEKELKAK